MSDNRHRYRTIRSAIKELHPPEPRGNAARHLHTLAALISGIVGSKQMNLPAIGCALALAWIVVKGSKGHFPEEAHIELPKHVRTIVPEHCTVI